MTFFDIVLYVSIAFVYNLFIHNLASISYKNLQYNEKHECTIVMLVIFGVLGVVISKFVIESNKKYKNSVVSNGLKYGGILLLITAMFANWDNIAGEMKLLMMGGILGYLIWYSYKRDDTEESYNDENNVNDVNDVNDVYNDNNDNNDVDNKKEKELNSIQVIEDILKNSQSN